MKQHITKLIYIVMILIKVNSMINMREITNIDACVSRIVFYDIGIYFY